MSKATPTNVINLGFDSSQFGKPSDWDTVPGGYLQRILDDVALELRDLIGAVTYDAAASDGTDAQKLDFMRIKNAEMYLAGAELWRRIEMFERTNAVKGHSDSSTETISSRALRNAEVLTEQADSLLMKMGVSLGASSAGGIAVGVNESGPYTAVTS